MRKRKSESAKHSGFTEYIKNADSYAILRGAIVVLVFVALTTAAVLDNTYKRSRSSAIETLNESAAQSSARLQMTVRLCTDRLRGLANILSGYDDLYSDATLAALSSNETDGFFTDFAIRFPDGVSLQSDGSRKSGIVWSSEDTIFGEIQSKYSSTIGSRTTSAKNGKDIFRIFVPIVRNNEKIADVYGVVETEALSSSFVSSGFGGQSSLVVFESHTGNVILDTGNWLGLSGLAIGGISKQKFVSGHSSREFFNDISNKKNGHTIISRDNVNYVCVYVPVGIRDWYIMQLVPQNVLYADAQKSNHIVIVELGIMLVGMLLFILWTYRRVELLKRVKRNAEYEVSMRDKILATALSDVSMRVMLYFRGSDELVMLKNGSETQDGNYDNSRKKNGLEYIIGYEKLDSDDARRMKNSIALIGTGSNMKFTVCSRRSDPAVFLRYTLSCMKSDGENVIICTARDVTDSELKKQKLLDVESFRNSVVEYKTTGLELFLERGLWRFVWNNEPYFAAKGCGGEYRNNYDNDLQKLILPAIKPSDRPKFANSLNRLTLLEAFRHGVTEKCIEYMILSSNEHDAEYVFRVLEVHLLRDKSTDEAKANIYIRNVEKKEMANFSPENKSKLREHIISSVFRAFADDCLWLGYAEFVSNTLIVVSSDGKSIESDFAPVDFDKHMSNFVNTIVHPEDRCACHSLNAKQYLMKRFEVSNTAVSQYRKLMPGSKEYITVEATATLVCKTEDKYQVVFVERRIDR